MLPLCSPHVALQPLNAFHHEVSAMEGGESFNQRVGQCLVWEKVKEGHVHLITTEDIEELFHAFEVYEKIPTSELVRLCSVDGTHLSAEDIAEWIKDSDKDGTGEVSVEDVHKGITEGAAAFSLVKRALFGEEKELAHSCRFSMLLSPVRRKEFSRNFHPVFWSYAVYQEHKITECSIHELLHWMHYEYDPCRNKDSAGYLSSKTFFGFCCFSKFAKDKKSKLWSLPETLFLFTAFVISVVLHLNVWEAFKSSRVYNVALTYGALPIDFLQFLSVEV